MLTFFRKYGVWVTTAIAICLVVYMIIQWNVLAMPICMVIIMYAAVSLHEVEEMLTGFEEENVGDIGVQNNEESKKKKVRGAGLGQLLLFFVSLYVFFIPLVLYDRVPWFTWMAASPLILGMIEFPSHIMTVRTSKIKRRYYPGLITAITIIPVCAVFGVYFLIIAGTVHWWGWLLAIPNILLPVLIAQIITIRAMGGKWSVFIKASPIGKLFSKK